MLLHSTASAIASASTKLFGKNTTSPAGIRYRLRSCYRVQQYRDVRCRNLHQGVFAVRPSRTRAFYLALSSVTDSSTPVCLFCNSSLKWPRHSLKSASPPATPTSSPVYRRSHRPKHSSSAGVRTGRIPEPHLLPAKHVSAWIQNNLYLSLADTPFDREDPTLNPAAGACVTCPRRSGYNISPFSDVTDGDQCKLCGIRATASIFRWLATGALPA
jgi:hypothetical protein